MSIIDLIVTLLLLWALISGWRQGIVLQLCSLAGIVLGAWLGLHFGAEVGELLHLDEQFATAGGFLTIFIVVLLAVALLGRLLRKVFHFAGFGIADRILGMLAAVAKTLLILCLLFSAFDSINRDESLVDRQTLDKSICYRPIINLSEMLFPFLEWAKEQITTEDHTLWNEDLQEM